MKEFERTTSLFSSQFIHHQEALFAKSLKATHVINKVVKTKTFIRASVLNYREFLTLLWEIVSGYGDIFYHSIRCGYVVDRFAVLLFFFYLLKEIKLSAKRKTKDWRRMDFVYVTGHFRTLNKELQSKDKLITEMS